MAVEAVDEYADSIMELESFVVIETNTSEYQVPVVANECRLEVKFRVAFLFVPRYAKGSNTS